MSANSRPYILFDDDLDGWGAAYAAHAYFGEDADYQVLDHGTDRDEVPWDLIPERQKRDIYVLDYHWSVEQMLQITAHGHDLTIVDHHESMRSELENVGTAPKNNIWVLEIDPLLVAEDEDYHVLPSAFETSVGSVNYPARRFDVCYDEHKSAASLAWHLFHKSEPPKLLQHIEDRDLWNWDMEHTDEVLLGLQTEEVTINRIAQFAHEPERLLTAGSAIVSYRDEMVDRLIEDPVVRDIQIGPETYTFGLVNTPVLRSKAGHKMLEQNPEIDVAALFRLEDLSKDATIACSLRSREDGPHVGEIATDLDGGGHANAAGCGGQVATFTSEDPIRTLISNTDTDNK